VDIDISMYMGSADSAQIYMSFICTVRQGAVYTRHTLCMDILICTAYNVDLRHGCNKMVAFDSTKEVTNSRAVTRAVHATLDYGT
jgi:hypothetical protein